MERATALAASLGCGRHPAAGGRGGGPQDTTVPDGLLLAFSAALQLGRHGAVEELMGNASAAERMYAQAEALLRFLLLEAPLLDVRDPLQLDAQTAVRLRRYEAEIAARRRACVAAQHAREA